MNGNTLVPAPGEWQAPPGLQQPFGLSPDALQASLNTLEIGLEIWNARHELVWHSVDGHATGSACGGAASVTSAPAGSATRGEAADCPGNGMAHSIQRHFRRLPGREPALQHLADDRWFRTVEIRTPDGLLLVVRVDVTELVRQGRQLEASNRRLNEMSVTDSLTGLANRRCLDEVLAAEWQRATRNQTDLALVMVDIDHFKRYNDHYGHPAGDACLRRVANVLKQCTRRAGELAARYGGEEFVMLLPGSNREHAMEVAELCMRLLQMEGIPHAVSPSADMLTLSCGVACLQDYRACAATELVNAADAAMYRAKMAGRACYRLATVADWEIEPHAARTSPAALSGH